MAYEIQVADADGVFAIEDYYCDGAVEPCLSQRYCEIPMSVLKASSYNLKWNNLIVAKVRARNLYGWSLLSEANTDGARIQTAPAKIQDLVEDNSMTSEEQLVFRWSLLTTGSETGGTEIISYNVQYDRGTNSKTWFNLAGFVSNFIDSEYIATAEINKGTSYNVRVRARNYWGWGEFSEILTIKASTVPDEV